MATINVGPGAVDLGSWFDVSGKTMISVSNPCNGTGTLDSMSFYFYYQDATDVKCGTFITNDLPTYSFTNRDYEVIGNVSYGSKQTFTGLNCSVVVGDRLGVYTTSGYIEGTSSGSGVPYENYDYFDGTTHYYYYSSSGLMGIEASGTGTTVPTLTTTSVTNITATTASSGGNITDDGGASVTARGVCWNTSSSPTIANSKTTDGTGVGSFTSSITGLTQGNTYYVRSYATNSMGTSYGNEISFSSLSGKKINTIINAKWNNSTITKWNNQ
jgi:hypothetical protein